MYSCVLTSPITEQFPSASAERGPHLESGRLPFGFPGGAESIRAVGFRWMMRVWKMGICISQERGKKTSFWNLILS